ncbi:hypothetical protein [Paraferrimonas haliotis]|uniref:Outer membrane protein beta-barrel domain-containing protein n=1 Tax=Paraferrimonas haliotis TaxID=2013866 RepID=A0AA37TYK8_9GAMM|nr:hypothetical protein [Paraferrimonas haliotis]GLS83651.1 hypothetical protein GCM10007894_16280 [Paraferrimonas haliotis]
MGQSLSVKSTLGACVLLLSSFTATSAPLAPIVELGVGVQYGFVGTQIHLPLQSPDFTVFGAFGVNLKEPTSDVDSFLAGGIGAHYYLDKHHALTGYLGVLKISEEIHYNWDNPPPNYLGETEYKRHVGASLGYKYYWSGYQKSGFNFGVSYNQYKDDGYPAASIGYRAAF